MRISDWSSDVCSSDLPAANGVDELLLDAPSAAFRRIDPDFGQACLAAAARFQVHFAGLVDAQAQRALRAEDEDFGLRRRMADDGGEVEADLTVAIQPADGVGIGSASCGERVLA